MKINFISCIIVPTLQILVACSQCTSIVTACFLPFIYPNTSNKLSYIRQVNINGKTMFKVYPDPVTSTLHNIPDAQVRLKELSLLHMTGCRILSRWYSQSEYSLDISPLPAGIYLLVLHYANEEFTYAKIIKR